MSKAKEFFEKLGTDNKAKELFKGKAEPKTGEELVEAYLDAAKQLGYDLTSEDIVAYIKEKQEKVQSGTDSAAKAVQALPDDALDSVAGGGDHTECNDTFRDKENCWATDGCDYVFTHYDEYVCNRNYNGYKCGSRDALICTSASFK
jgi:hypothetical protein